METLNCHSNQSSYPPGIKDTNYVEATVRNMCTKYRLNPHDSFWEEDFECFFFFKILPFMGPKQPIKIRTKLTKNIKHYSINISAKTKFKCLQF